MSLKILHSLESLAPNSGGPARSVPQLAIAQAARGMEVGLWSPAPVDRGLPDLPDVSDSNFTLHSGAIAAALEEFGQPDLIHDHGIWLPCHRAVAKLCRKKGICRVVSPRGMLAPWALNHKKWKKRLAWLLYQKYDLQTASGLHATAAIEAHHLEMLGLRPLIFVAPNGVQIRDSGTVGAAKEFGSVPAKKRQTSGRRNRTALFLGRVHPIKGLPVLLDAWHSLRPDGWKMRIVGPDEEGHRAELMDKVAKAGLSDDWSFEDGLEGEGKWSAMAAADLFILASHSENFGIVVAEALASGTPVITTTGTPWKKIVENACGWWVDPTVAALAGALAEACAITDEERSSMGSRGRDWIAADFGWDEIAEKMENFYHEILDGR